jgi:voltage-gated potassium channel
MGGIAVTSVSVLPDERRTFRDAFNRWFVTHEVAWELAMAALAIGYVALGFIVDDANAARPEIEAAELVLTGIFAVEFVARILASRSRMGYLRGHWIDVVALAPPIRGARVLRLLRLLRLVRAFAGIYRAGLHLQALARHRGFAWLLVAWLGVMAVCSAWLYVAEHGANKALANPFDALWWGVVTLTTVGYGDVTPITTEGKVAAMVLMLLGIGLFGAITATITSYLMSRESHHDSDYPLPGELKRLAALHASGVLTDDEFKGAKPMMITSRPTRLRSSAFCRPPPQEPHDSIALDQVRRNQVTIQQ